MVVSRKVYVPDPSRPDIRVPMREVPLSGGEPAVRLYDTSGPFTDPHADIDLKRGLPPLREAWIHGRGDVEELARPSSEYRRRREEDPTLGGVVGLPTDRARSSRPLRSPPPTVASDFLLANGLAQLVLNTTQLLAARKWSNSATVSVWGTPR